MRLAVPAPHGTVGRNGKTPAWTRHSDRVFTTFDGRVTAVGLLGLAGFARRDLLAVNLKAEPGSRPRRAL